MAKKRQLSSSSFYGARITSIISSSLVLFLLGILIVMSLIARELSSYVKENIGFSVILSDHISDAEIKKIEKRFDTSRYVKSSEVFTKKTCIEGAFRRIGRESARISWFSALDGFDRSKVEIGLCK